MTTRDPKASSSSNSETSGPLALAPVIREELEQLIDHWRTGGGICDCTIHCDCDATGYQACADDLDAFLEKFAALRVLGGAPEQQEVKKPMDCSEVGSARALSGNDLLNTIDGKVWADEFCRVTGFTDEAWALAWFCNAIMTGFDEGRRRSDREHARAVPRAPDPLDTLSEMLENSYQARRELQAQIEELEAVLAGRPVPPHQNVE